MKAAVDELESAREEVADWPLERDDWGAIEGGLRRIYRQGRRRMREAENEPSTEALHEWRKRVKDLWYHLSLLRETWPAVVGPEADEAHALSEKLGDDHDLAVLWDFACRWQPGKRAAAQGARQPARGAPDGGPRHRPAAIRGAPADVHRAPGLLLERLAPRADTRLNVSS